MEFYSNVEEGIEKLNNQIGEVKENTEEIKNTTTKQLQLTPYGQRQMNMDAYVSGDISLDEFVRREKKNTFSITKEEWDSMSLAEQSKLYNEYPEKIDKLLDEISGKRYSNV